MAVPVPFVLSKVQSSCPCLTLAAASACPLQALPATLVLALNVSSGSPSQGPSVVGLGEI